VKAFTAICTAMKIIAYPTIATFSSYACTNDRLLGSKLSAAVEWWYSFVRRRFTDNTSRESVFELRRVLRVEHPAAVLLAPNTPSGYGLGTHTTYFAILNGLQQCQKISSPGLYFHNSKPGLLLKTSILPQLTSDCAHSPPLILAIKLVYPRPNEHIRRCGR